MPDNLQQASRRSQYQSNVSQLDSIGSDPANFEFIEPTNAIEFALAEFVDRVTANINSEPDFVVTGKIAELEIKTVNDSVQVLANPWLIYQSRGVNGSVQQLYNTPHKYTNKMPPVQVFKDWIREKRIRLINNETYYGEAPFKELTEDEMIDKAAWGMAKNVFKNGFKPRDLYEKEIPLLITDLEDTIADFCVQQITQQIDLINPATNRIILKK